MIKVINSGLLSSFQDKGRYGYKKFGVSRSGSLDFFSFDLANKLTGNSFNEPCLEIIGGFSCLFLENTIISITGPLDFFSVNENFIYRTNSSIRLNAGDKLDIPNSQKGNIFYLSVAGGFRIQEVLGSYSYHQPSDITNSLKLSNGDMIKLKINNQNDLFISQDNFFEKNIFNEQSINIIYDQESKSENIKSFFEDKEFIISDQFSRQGIRLIGEQANFFKDQDEISSEVSAGTIQLPPDGNPIILLNDSQTTGGYKKIGAIPKYELSKLCQKIISSKVKFSEISLSDSISKFRKLKSEFENINIQNYINKVLEINGRLISVQILENNSIISISEGEQFEVIEDSFE